MTESPEIDLVEGVEKNSQYIIEKNIYSSWCKQLEEICVKHGINEIHIAGIDTDCCILKTATDLFENGIRPKILSECCASNGGDESHKAAIKVLERTIGREQIL